MSPFAPVSPLSPLAPSLGAGNENVIPLGHLKFQILDSSLPMHLLHLAEEGKVAGNGRMTTSPAKERQEIDPSSVERQSLRSDTEVGFELWTGRLAVCLPQAAKKIKDAETTDKCLKFMLTSDKALFVFV